ncbi:Tn3 family transposase [Streptomyces sp. NPDC000594]|uniref:Tn3 family transposase n=1 Tax=Streptomyces sp. NPDC000594 TaxID=3154261 RepID=UPI00331E7894
MRGTRTGVQRSRPRAAASATVATTRSTAGRGLVGEDCAHRDGGGGWGGGSPRGLALSAVVLWNSLYLDRAAKHLAADGFPVTDDLLAHLSPPQFDHINFLGRYAFFRPAGAGLRPLREPSVGDDESGLQVLYGWPYGVGSENHSRWQGLRAETRRPITSNRKSGQP